VVSTFAWLPPVHSGGLALSQKNEWHDDSYGVSHVALSARYGTAALVFGCGSGGASPKNHLLLIRLSDGEQIRRIAGVDFNTEVQAFGEGHAGLAYLESNRLLFLSMETGEDDVGALQSVAQFHIAQTGDALASLTPGGTHVSLHRAPSWQMEGSAIALDASCLRVESHCVGISPDGCHAVVAGGYEKPNVQLVTFASEAATQIRAMHATSGTYSPRFIGHDGHFFAVGGGHSDGKVEIFRVSMQCSVRCLKAPGGCYQYSLCASGGLLAASGYGGRISFWNVETWEVVHTQPLTGTVVKTICLSEDVQLLGCAGGAGKAHYGVYALEL